MSEDTEKIKAARRAYYKHYRETHREQIRKNKEAYYLRQAEKIKAMQATADEEKEGQE